MTDVPVQQGGGSGRGRSGGRGGRAGRGRGKGGRGRGRGAGGNNNNEGGEGGKVQNKKGNRNRGVAAKEGESGGSNKNRRRSTNNKKGGQNNKEHVSAQPQISEEEKQRLAEERKKAAEAETERKRIEAEQKALEVSREKCRKAKEDLEQTVKEASDYLKGVAEAATVHKENRESLSSETVAASRKSFAASKKSLKSDLKKCTAFVKKVKSGGAWSMKPADIVRDISTLNLSRYVEEVVAALLDAKLKLNDLPVVVALCKAMYQRYPEFLSNLFKGLWSVIQGKPTEETAKLRRIYVRLITEFLLSGISTDTKTLVRLIAEAAGGKDGGYIVTDANIVAAFVKTAGFEIFGITPRSMRRHTALIQYEIERLEKHKKASAEKSATEEEGVEGVAPKEADKEIVISSKLAKEGQAQTEKVETLLSERAVSTELSGIFLMYCKGAYKTLSKELVATHGRLQKMEKRCEQDRLLSGSLTEGREKGLNDARKLREALHKKVEDLSDVLDLPMPTLREEENEEAEGGGVGVELWMKSGDEEGGANFGPFDDEETRAFYCDIPDLLTTVPPALLGISQDEIDKRKADNLSKYGSGFDSLTDEADGDADEVAPSSEAQLEAAEMEESKETEESPEESTEENKDTPHYKLMVLIEQELPECSRREQIDEIAEKFCTNHGSSRNSRKRLSQTLFLVPRTRLDLLPYYSRMAATLCRVWLDISASLVTDLEQQFHGQAKYKKNQNIESRLRTARYIGELTKFRLAPPIVAFRCIRRCLDDFTGGNVDVACCVLESCGRYLYRLKHTNPRLTKLMDTMMRLSKAKHLDERSQAVINTAFYTVKPPASGPKKQAKVYPPLEGYLRHLLMVRLQPTESSIAFVSKQLIRFPWADPSKQCGALICRIMLKACRRGRYKAIQAVASVAAKLRRHKPEVCIRLIDSVLEELQWAVEHPAFKDQQRTITIARLLGELYCASLASGQLVIQQLYKFINFGHGIPDALREASEKQAALTQPAVITAASSGSQEQAAVFNSASGVSHTIQEDEEMDGGDLEARAETNDEPEPVAVSAHSRFDPRVSSPLDPPNSVFRIKLVCTLFEAVSKSIVTRNNLSKIGAFLASFQRYLFTKMVLPTDVEFSLLDTFDMIDSQWRKVSKEVNSKSKKGDGDAGRAQGFPRYYTWLEAHNITVANEEADATFEARAQARVEALAGDAKASGEVETLVSDLLNEEDDLMDDDDDSTEDPLSVSAKDSLNDDHESYQYSADEGGEEGGGDDQNNSQSGDSDDDDDDSDDEGSDDDSDDDEASEEEFDEQAYMQQLEDEAFERELRRLTMDALEKGKATTRGGKVADTMPTGSQFIRKKQNDDSGSAPAIALGGKAGISFQLLKKGNRGKMEAKQFFVPSDTNLAAVATKQDDEAARERDMIKARVLQYEAKSAESTHAGGNVYLEQEKLQVIRNRPLSMDEIDRNFGTSGGNLRSDKVKNSASGGRGGSSSGGKGSSFAGGRGGSSASGRGSSVAGGRGFGGGRGRGRGGRGSSSGRTLV